MFVVAAVQSATSTAVGMVKSPTLSSCGLAYLLTHDKRLLYLVCCVVCWHAQVHLAHGRGSMDCWLPELGAGHSSSSAFLALPCALLAHCSGDTAAVGGTACSGGAGTRRRAATAAGRGRRAATAIGRSSRLGRAQLRLQRVQSVIAGLGCRFECGPFAPAWENKQGQHRALHGLHACCRNAACDATLARPCA